jgi:hypothetical protein
VVSALPTGGAPHAILRSRQNRQAIAGLRRALRFVDGNFNTPCPALGFGTKVGVGSAGEDVAAVLSMRVTVDVGVPVSEDEKDEERGVGIRAPGEYGCEPGISRDGGGGCLYTEVSISKLF